MATTKKSGNSDRAAATRTEKRLIALVWVIACRNGVQGKSESAGYSLLPRVFSNPTPTASIRSHKGLVVLIGFILFLSCLWMFNWSS